MQWIAENILWINGLLWVVFAVIALIISILSNCRIQHAFFHTKTGIAFCLIVGVVIVFSIIKGGGIYFYSAFPENEKPSVSESTDNSSSSPSSTTSTPFSVSFPSAATPAPESTPTPEPIVYPAYNGEALITSDYECICPFTISADDNTDFYVYLEYISEPPSSYQNRQLLIDASSPYENDLAIYLCAGNTVEINVPVGVYRLYYATGEIFYGTELLFGYSTNCYTSDELLDFYVSSQYYQGHSVSLYTVYNGNFETNRILKSDFPKR